MGLGWQMAPGCQAAAFAPQKIGFAVKFKDAMSAYRVLAVYVLPDERITFEVMDPKPEDRYLFHISAGKTEEIGTHKWRWEAPQTTGLYPVEIIHLQNADSMTFNVFVMVPYHQLLGDYLNGYRMGRYPLIPLKQLPIYKPPRGFVEVAAANEETLLSPHFTLKQFLCKQEGNFPKYAVLREKLLLKLELIVEKVNEKGYTCNTFNIMSGYRTPYYNKAIGNVKYSRHICGGAADIFIDENPLDDMMDDLNGDGRINYHDVEILYDIIDEMFGRPFYLPFVGGLAWYKKTSDHGPFVHVDTRGFRARWGS